MTLDIQFIVNAASYTGSAIAMGFGAIGAAIGVGYTAAMANSAIGEKPESSGTLFKTMLVGQAIAESASIFALVIAVLLFFRKVPAVGLHQAAAVLGAGISMGFGAIGSGIGSGIPGGQVCLGIARQPAFSGRLIVTFLIGSAVSQTPAILAMIVALMLMFIDFSNDLVTAAALLGAGISMGFGGIGPGIGNGMAAESAVKWIARNLEITGDLMRTMLVGQAVSQSTAIYAMVVSLVLIFVV